MGALNNRTLFLAGMAVIGVPGSLVDFTKLEKPIWEDPKEDYEKRRRLQSLVRNFERKIDRFLEKRRRNRVIPERMYEPEGFLTSTREMQATVMARYQDVIDYYNVWSQCVAPRDKRSMKVLEKNMRNIFGEKLKGRLNFDFIVTYWVSFSIKE